MKKVISLIVAVAVLVAMTSVFTVSAAPGFQSSIDAIGGVTTAAHGGPDNHFNVPGNCGGDCAHPTYSTIVQGDVITLAGWLVTDAGVSAYEYSLDGGATWSAPVYGIVSREDLGAHGIPYAGGYATAGFNIVISTETWALGTYDVTVRAVDGNGAGIEFITFSAVEVIEDTVGGDVDDISDITFGKEYKLLNDITGDVTLSIGTYVIDLNGHTWNGGTVITANGADITVIDSSAEGTGKIVATSDAINVNFGSFTAKGIEIYTEASGCDGLWIRGGTVIVEDCVITATGNAAIHNRNDYGTGNVTVNGGTFSGKYAFKSKYDGVFTVGGDCNVSSTTADYFKDECTKSFEELMTASEGYVVSFDVNNENANFAAVTIEEDPNYIPPATEQPSETPSEEPSDSATDEPATDEPATDAPATDAPATDAPATDAPATDAPEDEPVVETADNTAIVFMIAVAALVATVVIKKRAF